MAAIFSQGEPFLRGDHPRRDKTLPSNRRFPRIVAAQSVAPGKINSALERRTNARTNNCRRRSLSYL